MMNMCMQRINEEEDENLKERVSSRIKDLISSLVHLPSLSSPSTPPSSTNQPLIQHPLTIASLFPVCQLPEEQKGEREEEQNSPQRINASWK